MSQKANVKISTIYLTLHFYGPNGLSQIYTNETINLYNNKLVIILNSKRRIWKRIRNNPVIGHIDRSNSCKKYVNTVITRSRIFQNLI